MNQKSSSVGQVNIRWSWRGWGKADACQSGEMSQHVPRPADSSTLPHELGRETVEAEMPGQQTSPPECYSSAWLKSSCSEAQCLAFQLMLTQNRAKMLPLLRKPEGATLWPSAGDQRNTLRVTQKQAPAAAEEKKRTKHEIIRQVY